MQHSTTLTPYPSLTMKRSSRSAFSATLNAPVSRFRPLLALGSSKSQTRSSRWAGHFCTIPPCPPDIVNRSRSPKPTAYSLV